jgi:hypothetical protein
MDVVMFDVYEEVAIDSGITLDPHFRRFRIQEVCYSSCSEPAGFSRLRMPDPSSYAKSSA